MSTKWTFVRVVYYENLSSTAEKSAKIPYLCLWDKIYVVEPESVASSGVQPSFFSLAR